MPIMNPPLAGVKVRMYRQGHGDCFLLSFRQTDDEPFYLLIDCGLKKGSEVHHTINDIADDIRESTDGHIHLVVVTHEHEDHVSGFLRADDVFKKIEIDELWLAWTEDPNHELANQLREKYNDTLLGLVAAGYELRGATESADVALRALLEDLLEFEFEDGESPLGADEPKKIKGITNKKAIKLLRERASRNRGTRYLRPHKRPLTLPNVPDVRIFVLGPPEDERLLKDMNPVEGEEFHLAAAQGEERSLYAAVRQHAAVRGEPFGFRVRDDDESELNQPFASRYRVSTKEAAEGVCDGFFDKYLGATEEEDEKTWRRIDHDWLRASEQFALRMSSYVNNTSLVLAIELGQSKKVLLFVGDAQRGNWVSWNNGKWTSGNSLTDGEEIDSCDLLNRTVFYKFGHHGSHNATLNEGGLAEMAQGEFARHFVAMCPANENWAKYVKRHPWQHPLDAIYYAVYDKARGRVFLSDIDEVERDRDLLSLAEWKRFQARTDETTMYFEYTVEDIEP